VPFSQVEQYYRNSDVFVFCSLRESFGSQLNEAMAFSLPLITLDIHGAGLFIPHDCGIKITPASNEQTAMSIADAIVRFSEDVDFRMACSRKAFEFSKQNTWSNKIDAITTKFYEQ
jgi:glycosyltransferase involved in cell wall biosynthesis